MILFVTSKNNLSNTTREFDKLDNNTPGIFSNLLPFDNSHSSPSGSRVYCLATSFLKSVELFSIYSHSLVILPSKRKLVHRFTYFS